jgi:hypothetical protein
MKTILLVSLSLLCACSLADSARAQSASSHKPIYEQETFAAVPSTFKAMFQDADAIVDVNVLSSEVKGLGPNPKVRTFYTAKVNRVLKGHSDNNQITFSHAAGTLELPDRILRGAAKPLEDGQRYILFLYRDKPQLGGWTVLGEIEGAFRVRDGRVEPEGRGRVAEQQRNLSERAFEGELRQLTTTIREKE